MRFDFLAEPISADDPCGPDLEEAGDNEYNNYVLQASGLVPERYYDRASGRIYDRANLNLSDNVAAIAKLLGRTRDLKLLALDLRFHLLAGKLVGFSEALQGMAILVTGFWENFHPLPLDGDMVLRQNTLEGLDDLALIVPALQFAPVVEGRSRISYRNYLVANQKVEPWEIEERMNVDTIDRALNDEKIRGQLETSRGAVVASQEALATLRNTFIEKAGHTSAPSFKRLEETLSGMVAFLNVYLGISDEVAGEATAEGDDAATAAAAPVRAGLVKTHGAAVAALKAVEDYFLKFEASSPALIVVHQARLLVGRPLVEAMEALLPEPSTRAVLRFDGGFPFEIDIARMKSVTDNIMAYAPAIEEPSAEASWSESSDSSSDYYSSGDSSEETPASEEAETPAEDEGAADSEETATDLEGTPAQAQYRETSFEPSPTTFTAPSRSDASQLLSAVESYFRSAEPSSPVPILLGKARNLMSKDFSAILNEIIPRDEQNPEG
jgi:type VI secretion system protein ImpA